MTTVFPNAKGSKVLHPEVSPCYRYLYYTCLINISQQKRALTVRECARAQGFPDSYQFLSVNNQLRKVVDDVSHSFQPGHRAPLTYVQHK